MFVMSDTQLTDKQAIFCQEYIIDFNGARAARAAGYSADCARQLAVDTLSKDYIQEYIAQLMQSRLKKLEITQERVLSEIAKIAFSDPRSVMSWDADGVYLKASEELTDDEAAIVSEVTFKVTKDGQHVGLKLNDKQAALDKLARHLGIYKDGLTIGGDKENPIVTKPDYSGLSDAELATLIGLASRNQPICK